MVRFHIIHYEDRIAIQMRKQIGFQMNRHTALSYLYCNHFIKKYKVTYTEPTYKAVQVFPLLGHIGGVPVHWHEETSSCGGILLSEENARLYRC